MSEKQIWTSPNSTIYCFPLFYVTVKSSKLCFENFKPFLSKRKIHSLVHNENNHELDC